MSLYTPLPEASVRLLRLLPDSDENSRIQCQVFTGPLLNSGSSHPYEALSYVWGSEDNPQLVYIDDCELPVTRNLRAALSHLRDHFMDRIVWVDALCINQENDEEKGHQVEAMAKIYAKASRVIAWLGDAADSSDEALEVIRTAAEDQCVGILVDESHEPGHQAVLNLLERPWFQRMWVSVKLSTTEARITKMAALGSFRKLLQLDKS